MNTRALFTLSLHPIWRKWRRRAIRAQMKSIDRQLEQIARQRQNDFKAECHLQGKQALLQYELRNL